MAALFFLELSSGDDRFLDLVTNDVVAVFYLKSLTGRVL